MSARNCDLIFAPLFMPWRYIFNRMELSKSVFLFIFKRIDRLIYCSIDFISQMELIRMRNHLTGLDCIMIRMKSNNQAQIVLFFLVHFVRTPFEFSHRPKPSSFYYCTNGPQMHLIQSYACFYHIPKFGTDLCFLQNYIDTAKQVDSLFPCARVWCGVFFLFSFRIFWRGN